jgi:hypothetical protein
MTELGEPKRPLSETFSAFDAVKEHLGMNTPTAAPLSKAKAIREAKLLSTEAGSRGLVHPLQKWLDTVVWLDRERTSLQTALAQAEASNKVLVEALMPFADLGVVFLKCGMYDDSPWTAIGDSQRYQIGATDIGWNFITVGHLRSAAKALSGEK